MNKKRVSLWIALAIVALLVITAIVISFSAECPAGKDGSRLCNWQRPVVTQICTKNEVCGQK
jgi:hypothetical protein